MNAARLQTIHSKIFFYFAGRVIFMMMLTTREVGFFFDCHSQNILCNTCCKHVNIKYHKYQTFKVSKYVFLLFQTSTTTTPHTPIIKAVQSKVTNKLPYSINF